MLRWRASAAAAAGAGLLIASIAIPTAAVSPHPNNSFAQENLVSDIPGVARRTDPNLINPWGMSFSPTSPLWVSDADADVTTLYSGAVNPGDPLEVVPLVVSIPGGHPTGQVFNGTSNFVVSSGADSGPALFIFASETGMITGWNPSVPSPAPSTVAQVAVSRPLTIYKGLAISNTAAGSWLYAANFHSGRINVFDGNWMPVSWPGAFRDPSLPDGYAPFNIQKLGGKLFVTYAKQDANREDEVAGAHMGFVDEYTLGGHLVRRVASRGTLNAPWGLAWAPATGFGKFSGDLLVGNFGDGRINAFDPADGHLVGQLRHPDGTFVEIDGLWGLMFGNGTAGSTHSLLFTAGIADEAHGLLGTLEFAAP
jgi:uncharacterized protein (TIGR03118 family)